MILISPIVLRMAQVRRRVLRGCTGELSQPVLATLAGVLIVASLVAIFITQCPSQPKTNAKPFQGIGEVAAEETAKLLANHGKIVVLVLEPSRAKMFSLGPLEDTFKQVLKRQSAVSVVATEMVDPGLLLPINQPGGFLNAARFFEVLQKYPDVDAIVSLVGVPKLQESDYARLPKRLPKIVAVELFSNEIKKLFDEQVLALAIVPRPQASPAGTPLPTSTPPPTAPREWFEKYFRVVTPATAATLPG